MFAVSAYDVAYTLFYIVYYFIAVMLELSYGNLFLAVHISVKIVIVRVSVSFFFFFRKLFAEIVIICSKGAKFV